MLTAKDIMTKNPVTVSSDTEITHAAKLLLEKGVNGLPVTGSDGKVVGIICQSDLIWQQKKLPLPSVFILLDSYIPLTSTKVFEKAIQKISGTTVADVMTSEPVTVTPETGIEELAALIVDKKFHTLPVVEDGNLVGVVGKEDILRTLITESE